MTDTGNQSANTATEGNVDVPSIVAGRQAQMHPKLTEKQIDIADGYGTRRTFKAGENLWSIGDFGIPVHVILNGAIDIIRRDVSGQEFLVAQHSERGKFTGEVGNLSGRAAFVMGRAREDLETICLGREAFHDMISAHADMSELIMRSFILRRVGLIALGGGAVTLVGSRFQPATLRLEEFLTRNGYPYRLIDVDEDEDVETLLCGFGVKVDETPIAVVDGGEVLRSPSLRELADALGLSRDPSPEKVYDVAVIGAGPAGLASAVYAASEGLSVLVVEPLAPGGQAGTSSKIENYLGFPTGISGQALAGRAFTQAQKFGAEVLVPRRLKKLNCARPINTLELDNGTTVKAKSVVVASGARYRKLPLENLSAFEGAGVYYGATAVEGRLCKDAEVTIVGGGNSAGQAAVFLSGFAKHVHILVRGDGLADSMSRYLIRRIEESPQITLHTRTQVAALHGEDHLERLTWRNRDTGEENIRDIRHLYVFIGAAPNTDFIDGGIALDPKGFIKTGPDVGLTDLENMDWDLERRPFLLETSFPGVFAAGDVRAGSVKRVASAVGEGSVCVQFLHKVLAPQDFQPDLHSLER